LLKNHVYSLLIMFTFVGFIETRAVCLSAL